MFLNTSTIAPSCVQTPNGQEVASGRGRPARAFSGIVLEEVAACKLQVVVCCGLQSLAACN